MRKEVVFKNQQRLVIFLIMLTEVLGFSLILPLLPYLARDYGANAFQIGLISASFSFFQLISSPIMGRLSDKFGRKPMLVLSQASTMVSFVVLGLANSLELIFLSRIIDGMLGANFTIAQAYLSDTSSKKDRSKAFGISGVAFGIGFMIGPALGGFLSNINYSVPSFLAAGVSFLTILITWFLLPETVKKTKKFKLEDIEIIDTQSFVKFFTDPKILPCLILFSSFLLTHITWTSSFAIYGQKQLGLSPQNIGYVYAFVGTISIILRGFLLGRLIDRFGEKRLLQVSMVLILTGLGVSVLVTKLIHIFPLITLFATGSGLSRPLIMGNISRSVSEDEQGAILGVTNSLSSMIQIIGPLIGGAIVGFISPRLLGPITAIFLFLGWIVSQKVTKKEKRDHPFLKQNLDR